MVDGDEIAEAAGQTLGVDGDLGLAPGARRNGQIDVARAFFLGQQCDEAPFKILRSRSLHELRRRARREHAPGVHGDDPVPLLGLVHIGGGDDDAHAGPLGADVVDERPKLAARQRVHAGGRFVEDEQVRLVHERAAQTDLLFHAARELAGGALRKGSKTRRIEQLLDARGALRGGKAEQPRHEVDILPHAEFEIEILAEALGHVSDARASVAPVGRVGDVAAKHHHFALLHLLRADDQRQQRRFADAVGSDHADHAALRNVEREAVKRERRAIAMGHVIDRHDRRVNSRRRRLARQ